MQNYKVEVQNHSEGMEAQDLFLEIGFKKSTLLEDGYPKYVVADQFSLTDGKESGGAHISFVGTNYKKITLQELHAMVAPKQKEYLVKTDTGYVLQVLSDVVDGHDGVIQVPGGAMSYWEYNKHNVKFFSKIEKGSHFYHYLNKNSEWVLWDDVDFKIFEMKWQRESLNDQVASAEQARQEQTQTREISECDLIDSGKLIIGGLGESFPVGLLHHVFTQPEELPFISDTQATLNERQAQYGDFKDVAGMTQELLAVMEQYGYEDMPDIHKEAIHMICSKMARIVNGDHNHLDSWHDIGGYAKLIENNIK